VQQNYNGVPTGNQPGNPDKPVSGFQIIFPDEKEGLPPIKPRKQISKIPQPRTEDPLIPNGEFHMVPLEHEPDSE
jgi:hypothetical protein